jgi:hypothetical protein
VRELIQTTILKQLKPLIMKRILAMFLLAGSLVACNNSGETTGDKKDSLDSMATERKDMVDSTADQKKDMIDSSTDRKKDSLDRIDSMKKK